MDIFDRLGNLIRTILDDDPSDERDGFADADERAAWDELNAYMREEERPGAAAPAEPHRSGIPESLRRDFRNLEIPVGAPIDDVRKAYKRLLAAFHPDRHAGDPDKLRTATEVTKKLNQSFQRIREYYEGGSRA